MVSVMRATSESGDAPGVRVTNPAMPHISDAVEATFLNSHTRRLVRRWPREVENGGGWRSSSSRSFLPNKANDVKPFIFMVPTTYRPVHFRSLVPANVRKKPMAIPLVDLRLGHNRLAQSPKEGLGQARPIDRKSTRLNSSHLVISYAVFCLK